MITILLIDDSSTFLKALSFALRSKTVNVLNASSTQEALDKLKKIKFDLVISDYDLGSDNGLTILKHLRSNNNNVKFIMLTGKDSNKLKCEVEKENGIFLDKGTFNLVEILKKEISKL